MDKIKKIIILNCLKRLDRRKVSIALMDLRAISFFLKYLFDQRLLKEDTSLLVPNGQIHKAGVPDSD